MKSIEDTLEMVNKMVKSLSERDRIYIALAGGYGAIAHGVERTTVDVDFCLYADIIHEKGTREFITLLEDVLPNGIEIKFVEGSKVMDEPSKHDVIFLYDKSGQYPRIDIIIARYKWELEGIRMAKPLEDIPFPVLPKPYLIAMKLKAGSLKDDYDVVEIYSLLTEDEKKKTHELTRLIHRDKRLAELLRPRRPEREDEDIDQIL
ncbi:MAG: hypothetical protein Fur0020_14760 [Thermodesulfovibrionia bacterium]